MLLVKPFFLKHAHNKKISLQGEEDLQPKQLKDIHRQDVMNYYKFEDEVIMILYYLNRKEKKKNKKNLKILIGN
jgi:hypothetical protein